MTLGTIVPAASGQPAAATRGSVPDAYGRTWLVTPDRTAPKGTVAFHVWRGQALTHAAARRELWREHHAHSTVWLRRELARHEFHLSEYCRPYRSEHLRGVSAWYVRMIRTELRRRGASASLTRMGAQS